MIRVDMKMPENCYDCPFMGHVAFNCYASGDPGFVVFCGLPNSYNWDEWKAKAKSERDPRCPMHDEHDMPCFNCPMQPVRPTWRDNKAYCGQCGKRIPLKINANYCHKCGRGINWLP